MTDTAAPPEETPALIGTSIGKYKVERQLGRGGMGAVYEAVQEEIGQRVAIKVMHPELSREGKFAQRFFDEARAISKVKHPGLIQVYLFDRLPDGTLYLVMELLTGELLWDRMQKFRKRPEGGAFTVQEASRLARQIASAFATVHQNNIIHRDLKPENVFIVPDSDTPSGERAKILDFGIAKDAAAEAGARRTTTGVSIGTPGYMSPEQCAGAATLTDRSDVYALGVILYELLTGKAPFEANTITALMRQHITKDPPPLPDELPPALSAIVMEMLSKEPEPRPSMKQVVERLDALSSSLPVTSRAKSAPAPSLHRGALLGGGAVAALGVLTLVVWFVLHRPTSGTKGAGPDAIPAAITKPVEKPAPPPTPSVVEPAAPAAAPAAAAESKPPGGKNGKRIKKGDNPLFKDLHPKNTDPAAGPAQP